MHSVTDFRPRWMTAEDLANLEQHKECKMKLFTSSTKVLLVGVAVGYALGSVHGWSLAKASK
jgi:hypothetical protein